MRRIKSLIAMTAISISAIGNAMAQAQAPVTMADPEMMIKLKQLYPGTTFRQVNRTQFSGIYEVIMGQNVAYVEGTGRYWIFGHLFDMQTQQDLTAARLDETSRIDMTGLDLKDAIKEVNGNGRRTLLVFSDPDCPYCRQLDATVKKLKDVTVYTFMYPIDGLHPQARQKSIDVWCSQDRLKSWSVAISGGNVPKAPACADPLERIGAFAERNKITGTPTLLTLDGRKLPGAAPLAQIDRWLDATEKVAKAPSGDEKSGAVVQAGAKE